MVSTKFTLVLVRHGESVWNKKNIFTGWTDVDLSEHGEKEAQQAGKLLKAEGFTFDLAFTSELKRAQRTLQIIQQELGLQDLPVTASWHLNERHYGDLQGKNKDEVAQQVGQDQVQEWRRSYTTRPEALAPGDERDPAGDPLYADVDPHQLPHTESLKDTTERFLPYWHEHIAPAIKAGKRVLVAAHGNSLRALCKHLDGISDADISKLNIPTGLPLVYCLDADLRALDHHYLGAKDALAKKVAFLGSSELAVAVARTFRDVEVCRAEEMAYFAAEGDADALRSLGLRAADSIQTAVEGADVILVSGKQQGPAAALRQAAGLLGDSKIVLVLSNDDTSLAQLQEAAGQAARLLVASARRPPASADEATGPGKVAGALLVRRGRAAGEAEADIVRTLLEAAGWEVTEHDFDSRLEKEARAPANPLGRHPTGQPGGVEP